MNNQIEQMNKIELLEQIRVEYARLEVVISSLKPGQFLQPNVTGTWTIKDILAHITAWQQQMIRWTGMHMRGERPDTPTEWVIDKINEDFYKHLKDKPLEYVLKEFHQSHQQTLALVEKLSEQQLQADYTNTWPMGPLWRGIAANTFFHYREHREGIEKWLVEQ